SSRSTLAETTTIGVGRMRMIFSVASRPLIPGSRISIEITSGERRSRTWSASSAVSTAPATSTRGSRPIMGTSSPRTTRQSAPTSTRIFFIASKNLANGRQQFVLLKLGLHNVGVRPQSETALAVFAAVERGHHDYWNISETRVSLHPFEQAEAIEMRH